MAQKYPASSTQRRWPRTGTGQSGQGLFSCSNNQARSLTGLEQQRRYSSSSFHSKGEGRGPLHTALSSGALAEPVFTANRWAVPPQLLGTVILWSHQTPAGRKGQGAVLAMCGEQWLTWAKRSYNFPERKGKSHKKGLAWNSSPTLEARKHWNNASKFLKEAFSIILH